MSTPPEELAPARTGGRHAGPSAPHVEIVVHPDAATLAEATAARLLVRLLDRQSLRSPLHVALTGGTVGIATLRAVAASPVRDAVDWSGVHLWWGDERFVAADSPDRNDGQARAALLDALAIPPDNVHPVPAEGTVPDEDAAAAAYAAELARFAPTGDDEEDATGSGGVAPAPGADDAGGAARGPASTGAHAAAPVVPVPDPGALAAGSDAAEGAVLVPDTAPTGPPAVPEFDVVLLGVGPDGHVASLFPGHATLHDEAHAVVGEADSPKPPPRRVSLTFPVIRAAREVWLVVAGEEKSHAVARALAGAPVDEVPAAGAVGAERTLWLVDVAAASAIPTA